MPDRKKIAAVITEYRPNSHADVIVTKYLLGFPTDDGLMAPRVDVASMYVDQFPERDLGRQMSAAHDVPIYPSIARALPPRREGPGSGRRAADPCVRLAKKGEMAQWKRKDSALSAKQKCILMRRNARSAIHIKTGVVM